MFLSTNNEGERKHRRKKDRKEEGSDNMSKDRERMIWSSQQKETKKMQYSPTTKQLVRVRQLLFFHFQRSQCISSIRKLLAMKRCQIAVDSNGHPCWTALSHMLANHCTRRRGQHVDTTC
jgi:hypothetical protein